MPARSFFDTNVLAYTDDHDSPTKPLTTDEKRCLLAATAGAWATDPSLATVFAEIEQRRRDAVPRETTNLG